MTLSPICSQNSEKKLAVEFVRGKTYRHRNCLDVDMHVVRPILVHEDSVMLEVLWVNRHIKDKFTGTGMVHCSDRVTVQRKDFGNWSEL